MAQALPLASAAIDWQAPWLHGLRTQGRAACALLAQGLPVWQALHQLADDAALPWRFVPQDDLPAGMAYEQFIFETRCIPTRDNLHDFFNGLIWLRWPEVKQRCNALQAGAILAQGVGGQRGPLRDAITVLDENGALLLAPAALCEALRHRRWHAVFVGQRALWHQARLLPIGHALLEKLVQPRKPITAHVLCVPTDGADARLRADAGWEDIDAWLADSPWLQAEALARKPFAPLPVLGVPGWCHENENFSFYDDSLVFRAPRSVQAAQQGMATAQDPA
ncbi:DUF3025 domain-containing protein [Delftia sp. PS-11]|uniref:DUF3025 domain-containing protein n=1 Tax=Delftia sp. PS-11 TaxID=2767222 RepID=UPI0024560431|nr:DUF3025 domain-containing protein [Delftia sp. PS-11]KAJ8746021.1 DUF3025 domain-containing protein [Delftia sp. PS-11]